MAATNRKEGEMPPPPPPPPPPQPSVEPTQSRPTETAQSSSTVSKKGGKKISIVWDHFTRFTDEDGRLKAKCNYCPSDYYCDPKKNGTTALNTHMTKCKNHPCSSDLKQSQLSLQPMQHVEGGDESVVVGSLTSWRFDQEFCRIKLVEMIIKDELPFKIVEGEGFKEFVVALQAKFKIPSRWTISRDIVKLFEVEKVRLRDFFKRTGQSVCITTDTWTSLQRINYMCITAHWIDEEWKLTKKIINFCTIESHKGDDIGRQIDGCLREWGIKNVFSVTVDNASSNDTCLTSLKSRLVGRGCCLVGGRYLHMRCVAHIVNLVVQDGMKEMSDSIKKVRDAIRFVRQSPARLARFKICCKDENIDCNSLLCLDVPTRWNSTYLMLDVACKFEKAFDLYESRDPFYRLDLEDGNGIPYAFDWENARRMTTVLKTFYDLTVRISGSLYVTSNSFLAEISNMCCLLKKWVESSSIDVRQMGIKMKEKFDKYWGDPKKMNKLIFFSVVVDPRYKFEVLTFVLKELYGNEIGEEIARSVKVELYQLYDAYKCLHQSPSNATPQEELEASNDSTGYVLFDKYKKQKLLEGDDLSNDLDVYLTDKERAVINGKNFDILGWWKINQHRLPILAILARDVLSIPISTVASESAFSTGGRVLDPFRSSLTPRIVESLICTQDWLRKSKHSITIEEDLDAIQKHEEALMSLGIGDDAGDGDAMET